MTCDLLLKSLSPAHIEAAQKHHVKPVSEQQMIKLAPARRRIIDWKSKEKEPEDSDSNEYGTDDERQCLTDSEGFEDMFAAHVEKGK